MYICGGARGTHAPTRASAARAALESPHGDPFGLLNIFREWIHIKHSRREASHKWCRRHGLAEQRLYEMAKLKKQFEDILSNTGRRGPGGAVAGQGEV